MLRAIYPGSFDPVTFGHLDIIRRSSRLVDELIVGVLNNKAKSPLFSVEERVRMLEEVTNDIPNIRIIPFWGLLVDFAHRMEAGMVIRGLRAITDFEYELQMAQTNHKMKEVAAFGGDLSQFVPEAVAQRITEKMKKESVD